MCCSATVCPGQLATLAMPSAAINTPKQCMNTLGPLYIYLLVTKTLPSLQFWNDIIPIWGLFISNLFANKHKTNLMILWQTTCFKQQWIEIAIWQVSSLAQVLKLLLWLEKHLCKLLRNSLWSTAHPISYFSDGVSFLCNHISSKNWIVQGWEIRHKLFSSKYMKHY